MSMGGGRVPILWCCIVVQIVVCEVDILFVRVECVDIQLRWPTFIPIPILGGHSNFVRARHFVGGVVEGWREVINMQHCNCPSAKFVKIVIMRGFVRVDIAIWRVVISNFVGVANMADSPIWRGWYPVNCCGSTIDNSLLHATEEPWKMNGRAESRDERSSSSCSWGKIINHSYACGRQFIAVNEFIKSKVLSS